MYVSRSMLYRLSYLALNITTALLNNVRKVDGSGLTAYRCGLCTDLPPHRSSQSFRLGSVVEKARLDRLSGALRCHSNSLRTTNIIHRRSKCRHRYVNKSKAVPLHAMVALGGRGYIAPTHS
jgi:hypothetical protein